MDNGNQGCFGGIIIAIIAIIALFLFKSMLIWWVIGIIAFVIVMLAAVIIIMNRREKKKKQQQVAEGVTLGDVEKIIAKSNSHLQEIRRGYYKLDDIMMREELDIITDRCKQIFKIVKQDPKDIKAARRFLNTALFSLEKIISQSVRLFDAPNISEEGKKALENAKEGLILLRRACDSQINKFYENNILDLDVELEVLKKTLSARGLLDSEKEKTEDN